MAEQSTAVQERRQRLREHIDKVYRDGAVVDEEGGSRSIFPSGMSMDWGNALRDLIVSERAGSTIEVGFALGLSTLHICDALLSTDPVGRHIAIDPLEHALFGAAGLRSIEEAGVADLVDHIEESSDLALPSLLLDRRGTFDLALVDGAHAFHYAFVDSFFCLQLLRPGGVLVIDDTWMPGPRLTARYLINNLGCTEIPGVFPAPAASGALSRLRRQWPHMTALRTPAAGASFGEEFVAFHDPANLAGRVTDMGRSRARLS